MYQAMIEDYFETHAQELIEAVCRLVRIPSVKGDASPGKPFGDGPAAALREGLLLASELGFRTENLSGYVGTVDMNQEETMLHIWGHLDVVAGGPGWKKTDAFSPLLSGDLLYGRGTSDDKGPILAALFAMKAVKDLKIPLSKNVRLILGTDEESGMQDVAWYYERHPYAPHTFSPDAQFPVINLEKGHLQPHLEKAFPESREAVRLLSLTTECPVNMVPPTAKATVLGLSMDLVKPVCAQLEPVLRVSFTLHEEKSVLTIFSQGHATHASTPEKGINALTALITLLCHLPLSDTEATRTLHSLHSYFPHDDHEAKALGLAQSDELAGPLTLTLSVMDWTEQGMKARFDARTPRCATEENTLQQAKTILGEHGITLDGHLNPAHYVPEDSPFIQTLLRAYETYSGRKGTCLSMGGGTYVHNIPGGVAFGANMPDFVSHLHEPDECVSTSELLTACKIFTQVIVDLCSSPEVSSHA